MHAILVSRHGGPDVFELQERPDPRPGAGEALVEVEYAGVNFVDVYHRTGLYRRTLPFTPGQEGAGRVVAVGDDVHDVAVGDRVAWAMVGGSYATHAVIPATRLVPVPDGLELRTAAAALLQGMTAHFLATSTFPLGAGHTALVHAAAGGVGLLLCQVAKRRGARVIGTVSTPEKAARAREAGADDVILYRDEDFAEGVRRRTSGRGVDVVYDSVGRDTFHAGLGILRPRGMMVLFGQSSGPVPPLDLQELNRHGSLYVTRPSLAHYTADVEELRARARDVFDWITDGSLRVTVDRVLPLARAADAHRALEGRETSGKVLLATRRDA